MSSPLAMDARAPDARRRHFVFGVTARGEGAGLVVLLSLAVAVCSTRVYGGGGSLLPVGMSVAVIALSLGVVVLSRSRVVLQEKEMRVRPHGWLGGERSVGYEDISAVRLVTSPGGAPGIELELRPDGTITLGPWRARIPSHSNLRALSGELAVELADAIERCR